MLQAGFWAWCGPRRSPGGMKQSPCLQEASSLVREVGHSTCKAQGQTQPCREGSPGKGLQEHLILEEGKGKRSPAEAAWGGEFAFFTLTSLYFFQNSYWSIADSHCSASFCRTVGWIISARTYMPSLSDASPVEVIADYWTEFSVWNSRSLLRLVTLSCPILCFWTVAHQAPLSTEFSRQEYWSGLPFPPSGDPPNPGIEPASFVSLAL